ncbi:hypothetical protein WICMUC_005664 [Wickerhamomyces mucosus]|uniref:Thioredoxin-like fold domain-containing protein n=1 Tax=Wickerhamomyces mucosus TaxID=1378264 RepID=A0A9P8T5X7_9ASCO|nr:hypothetical protein WICMUC_005664 [Wickerhamomyces mucosus]
MSLLPKFAKSHIYPPLSQVPANSFPNTVEVFLDYACPFSAKIFKNWYNELFPKLDPAKHRFIFKSYVQPWHPTSNLLHEAAIAFQYIQPEEFLKFSYLLFDSIEEFYDTNTADLTRNEIYEKIYNDIVEPNFPKVNRSDYLSLLTIIKTTEKHRNNGNAVTNDLKWFTKNGRQQGIHVTPTVVINGYEDSSIESSTPSEVVYEKLAKL